MSLKIALYPNHLTDDESDCFAKIQDQQVVSVDEIINRMTGRGLSLLSTDVKKVMEEEMIAMVDVLHQGCTVKTPLMTITPTIRGKFDHVDDVFDPSRHSIEFIVKLGKAVEVDKNKIVVRKVKAVHRKPLILKVEDHMTETVDQKIVPAGTITVEGIDLKVNTEEPTEGLFFKSGDNWYKAQKFFKNTNKYLQVKVPPTLVGTTCTMEVRKRYPRSKQLYTSVYEVEFDIGL